MKHATLAAYAIAHLLLTFLAAQIIGNHMMRGVSGGWNGMARLLFGIAACLFDESNLLCPEVCRDSCLIGRYVAWPKAMVQQALSTSHRNALICIQCKVFPSVSLQVASASACLLVQSCSSTPACSFWMRCVSFRACYCVLKQWTCRLRAYAQAMQSLFVCLRGCMRANILRTDPSTALNFLERSNNTPTTHHGLPCWVGQWGPSV